MDEAPPKRGHTRVEFELLYHEVARRLLLKQNVEEIALASGLHKDTVINLMRRPRFRTILDELREKAYRPLDKQIEANKRNIKQEIQDVAGESLDRLKHLLVAASSETLSADIAKDFLDRAGFGKQLVAKDEITIKVDELTASILATALQRERQGRERLERLENPPLVRGASELERPADSPGDSEPGDGTEAES